MRPHNAIWLRGDIFYIKRITVVQCIYYKNRFYKKSSFTLNTVAGRVLFSGVYLPVDLFIYFILILKNNWLPLNSFRE